MTLDELEALRLADFLGKYQEEAAELMNVSRQTFGRILDSAHRKVADALLNGKALRVEGGPVHFAEQRLFECASCGHRFHEPFRTGRPQACPSCGSAEVFRADGRAGCRYRHGHRGGMCSKRKEV